MSTYRLARSLDTAAASPLRQELLSRLHLGDGLVIDGADVERVGQACLQVLASARRAAVVKNQTFTITDASSALIGMAELAGLAGIVERA